MPLPHFQWPGLSHVNECVQCDQRIQHTARRPICNESGFIGPDQSQEDEQRTSPRSQNSHYRQIGSHQFANRKQILNREIYVLSGLRFGDTYEELLVSEIAEQRQHAIQPARSMEQLQHRDNLVWLALKNRKRRIDSSQLQRIRKLFIVPSGVSRARHKMKNAT